MATERNAQTALQYCAQPYLEEPPPAGHTLRLIEIIGIEVMAHLKGETSNSVFAVLREWETTLQSTSEGPLV